MSYQEQAQAIIDRERPFQETVEIPRLRPVIALNSDLILQYIHSSRHATDILVVTGFVKDPLAREDHLLNPNSRTLLPKTADPRVVGTVPFTMRRLDLMKSIFGGEEFKYRLKYLGVENGAMHLDVASTEQFTANPVDSSEDPRFLLRKLRSNRPITRENPLELSEQELAVPIDFAHPIDAYIYRLRKGRFSLRDGTTRPVIPDNVALPATIIQGLAMGFVNADNLASSLFNVDSRNWSGTVENLQVNPVEPDWKEVRPSHPLIAIDSDKAYAFVAQADLVTLAGEPKAVLKRQYLLYTTKVTSRRRGQEIPEPIRDLAQQLYPRASLHDNGILWVNSKRLDFEEAGKVMRLDRERMAESNATARKVESAALFHPFQAGLMMPK